MAEAASLGPFVAEDWAEVVHPHWLGQVVHPVFQVGSADGRGAFGTQGDAIAAAVVEGVHLLFDDVGAFAHGADEQVGVLEGRGINAPIAEAVGDVHRLGLDVTPVFLLAGQVVGSAAGGSKDHGCYSVREIVLAVAQCP